MLPIQPPPLMLAPNATVFSAIEQMNQVQVSDAVVVENQHLVGVFTAQDLIRAIACGTPLTELTISQVMSAPPVTLLTSDLADSHAGRRSAWQHLRQHSPACLPVVNDQGQFVGVVSLVDVLETLPTEEAHLAALLPLPTRSSTKEVLRQAELADQFLWEVFPNLLIRMTRDGSYLDFVPAKAFKSFTPAPDLNGKTIFEVMPADFAHQRMHYIELALQTQHTQTYEFELEVDGEQRYQEAQITPSGEDEVLIIVRDITDRHQIESALRKSEERFQEIAKTVSQVFLIRCAQTHQFLYVSPAYETLWERSCESLYADPNSWLEAVHPDDLPLLTQSLKQQFHGNPATREYRIVRSDGSICWIKAMLSLVKDEAGQPLRFIGIAEDVTERKQAEEELRIQKQQLSLALEAAKAGTWEWEIEKDYAVWSEQCFQLMDYDPALITPSYENWLRSIHPDSREQVEQAAAKALSEKNYFYIEYRTVSPDDSIRWLADIGQSMRDREGNLTGAIGILLDITEKKQVEEELRANQRFIQSIADFSPNLLYLYDLHEHKNVYVNRRVEQALGYTSEAVQVMGNQVMQTLMHPDDFAAFDQNYQHIMKMSDGEVLEFEYRMRHSNGQWRWLRSLDTVFERTPDGRPKLLLGTAIDITDHKYTEQQLRFQACLLDAVEQAVVATDTSGYITYWNRGAETLYGWSAIEAIGQHVVELLASEFWKQKGGEILAQLQLEKAWSGEFEIQRKDGALVHIITTESPIYDEQQHLIGFIGVSTDITERKRTAAAIERSEKKYRDLVQMAGSIILRHDTSGRITFLNEYGQQFFGYRETDILNRELVGTLVPETESTGRNLRKLVANLCQDPQNHELAENENILSTGERVWVKWADKPIFNDRGEIVEILSVGVDITDRKRAEQALALAKEAAESASRAKSEFLSMMSHELRTPLTSILGFAEVIANDASLSLEHQNYLAIIRRSGTHLLNLINSVLEMSKIEAGEVILHPTHFDLYCLLENIDELFQLKATSKGLELIVDWAIDLPQYIHADESKLRQILINLLDNAIKFTEVGRVVFRSSLREQHGSAALLHIEVEDTGVGIAPNEMNALFNAFVQTEAGRRLQRGTGLGLAITHQFVQAMGGSITAQSQLGQGTRFTVEIPFEAGEPVHPYSLISGYQKSGYQKSGHQRIIGLAPSGTYRVLVVDDQPNTRTILVKLLESVGFEVCEAANGQEAIVIWQHWHPHLIWLDLRLPVMSGYEVAQQIRQQESQQECQQEHGPLTRQPEARLPPHFLPDTTVSIASPTKIIALTANALTEERSAVLAAGCNDFLAKPFQQSEILNKTAEQLNLKYCYADEPSDPGLHNLEHQENPQSSPTQRTITALTAAEHHTMPAPWFKELHHAALRLSSSQCLELIEQLPGSLTPLAQVLTEWVDRFQFEAIVEWLESRMHDSEPG